MSARHKLSDKWLLNKLRHFTNATLLPWSPSIVIESKLEFAVSHHSVVTLGRGRCITLFTADCDRSMWFHILSYDEWRNMLDGNPLYLVWSSNRYLTYTPAETIARSAQFRYPVCTYQHAHLAARPYLLISTNVHGSGYLTNQWCQNPTLNTWIHCLGS